MTCLGVFSFRTQSAGATSLPRIKCSVGSDAYMRQVRYTRYQRASRLASHEEEVDHLSAFSLSAPFSPTAKFLRTNLPSPPLLCSLSSAPGLGLQGLREGQVLVAFGFQTSKNGSLGEQWPAHLRDVNCVRNVTRRAFKNETRDFIVTNRDGWRVWSHLGRKSLCQAWD